MFMSAARRWRYWSSNAASWLFEGAGSGLWRGGGAKCGGSQSLPATIGQMTPVQQAASPDGADTAGEPQAVSLLFMPDLFPSCFLKMPIWDRIETANGTARPYWCLDEEVTI
jgi:hypothetical protein